MMKGNAILNAYEKYGRKYDRVFGRSLDHGRKVAVKKMNCLSGQKILEIGVGTGLSLGYYPERTMVVGIDISSNMLAQAKERVMQEGVRCKSALCLMDAENMTFSDGMFDKVVAMYVVSVTPNPEAMLKEMKRVCKPGGDIFIVNHFTNGNRVMRGIESVFAPLAGFIGFRPMFPMDELVSLMSLDVQETTPVNVFGICSVIYAKNRPPAARPRM
jgi:phosphatidylethanolamine/phosphatidyl-N-methylethanolamine N-methyltransferase